MKRRQFLHHSTIASTSLLVPAFLPSTTSANTDSAKKLVIIQLSGGNDGLNTVVPYENDMYYSSRPQLAIQKSDCIPITDNFGWNPNMKGMQELLDQGMLTIVNQVGYPNPSRSHFRSMDIWHTASNSDEYLQTGWIGRYLDHACAGHDHPHHALEIEDQLSLALKGVHEKGFAVTDPKRLLKMNQNELFDHLTTMDHQYEEENVSYLYKVLIDQKSTAQYLADKVGTDVKPGWGFNQFARDLKLVAELIKSECSSRIYYISLSGFDTHANQKNTQNRLLKIFADGIHEFVKDLKTHGLMKETLIFTFSEFGRRVTQNASRGTDHGTANNVFLVGESLQQTGFYNEHLDLQDLDDGDLKYEVDFRKVYADLLSNWLEVDPRFILNQSFSPLGLI